MSNRRLSETSDSIGLFPFLAVLLCILGSLMVLLIVFDRHAITRSAEANAAQLQHLAATRAADKKADQVAQIRQELAEIAEFQTPIAQLRRAAETELQEQQLRLSHSEEHTRRLQEELARLAIAAEQLQQTEQKQSVDQKQAEQELARLEKLMRESKELVENLSQKKPTKNSYAILPYKGPNGTYRKPIYIECSSRGVTIHPEGLQLTADDFLAPAWPGNPLAAALRASREYLNAAATERQEPEPPDPYPLLIVRPSGIKQYNLARAAITSWDSDYGYEFLEEDAELSFPELPNPLLAQVQEHAVMISRDRLAQLIESAPSRFRGMRVGNGMAPSGDTDGTQSGYGTGEGGTGYASAGSANPGLMAQDEFGSSAGSGAAGGASKGTNPSGGAQTPIDSEHKYGDLVETDGNKKLAGGTSSRGGSDAPSGTGDDPTSEENIVGSRYAQAGGGATKPQTNAPSTPLHGQDAALANSSAGKSSANGQKSANSAGSPGGDPSAAEQGNPSMSFSNASNESIADARGSNWAIERAAQKSVAIRRTIPVVVRHNQIALLTAESFSRGSETDGQVISLDQPIENISDEFIAALGEQIEEWGLAGQGMYWRPVLKLHFGPDAILTANRVVELLKDSGVEVQAAETARATSRTPPSSQGIHR